MLFRVFFFHVAFFHFYFFSSSFPFPVQLLGYALVARIFPPGSAFPKTRAALDVVTCQCSQSLRFDFEFLYFFLSDNLRCFIFFFLRPAVLKILFPFSKFLFYCNTDRQFQFCCDLAFFWQLPKQYNQCTIYEMFMEKLLTPTQ